MRISEVERLVGLSKKAIRLYESCGLLTVERISNGYRKYTDADVAALKQIKLLRLAGVSISDIKLLRYGILPMEELLNKRKKELDREYGKHSSQYDFCESLLKQLDGDPIDCTYRLEETEEAFVPSGALSVGIDIGTTTISASVIDHAGKRQIEGYSIANVFDLPCEKGFCEQDADAIVQRAKSLLDHILDGYENVCSVGLTGQMHGIVYVDTNGKAVSPLFTWEDKRADQSMENGETYCERIYRITGEEIYTGYGFATHYYMQENNAVPEEAATFCSIMDYFAMRLAEKDRPLVHATNAASFGFYDVKAGRFKTESLEKIFTGAVSVPTIAEDFSVVGEYRGVPLSVAIGDNQADFLGAVQDLENGVLVNFGTGSQISMLSTGEHGGQGLELRPFFAGKHLLCGAALCGGSAYAMLEQFFREYSIISDGNYASQYKNMNRIAAEAYARGETPLAVDTAFCGVRNDPARRGSISAIGLADFTPAKLILGVLYGMCHELHSLYLTAGITKKKVVASGGAVQKNTALQRVIAEMFATEPIISTQVEEAAVGAALFSAVACGVLPDIGSVSEYILHKDEEKRK